MKLILLSFVIWYLIDRYVVVAAPSYLPIGNITVFLGGVFTVILYLIKEEMPVFFFWTAKAGDYGKPKRLLGLAFAFFLIAWMIVYHLKGIKL